MKSSYTCDLCDSKKIEFVYKPIKSKRKLNVYICLECGLVQSFPKVDRASYDKPEVSGNANWGNIRYGKSFRTSHDLQLISSYCDIKLIGTFLDVGFNRGSFYNEFAKINNHVEYWGIEPDNRLIENKFDRKEIKLINERLEKVELPNNYFDFIYCPHTLEHLKSPAESISQLFSSLKEEGLFYIEVPNIEVISSPDILEEFFIDKHLYHFGIKNLMNYLNKFGLKAVCISDNHQKLNISILLRKSHILKGRKKQNNYLVNKKLIYNYKQKTLENNIKLKSVGDFINQRSDKHKIVIWGAGRLFDRLIVVGGLNPKNVFNL